MKPLSLLPLILLALSASAADTEGPADKAGNGGNGIRIRGKTYLLDLVEAGLERQPYAPTEHPDRPTIIARLDPVFGANPVPKDLVASKILEIHSLDQGLAFSILHAIEAYNWVFVDSTLADTNDDDTDLTQNPGQHVQLAARGERSIRISRRHWRTLDATHRAATVIHEAVFALIFPNEITTPEGTFLRQSSRMTREIVGYLFRPDFVSRGRRGLLDLLGGEPNRYLKLFETAVETPDRRGIEWYPTNLHKLTIGWLEITYVGPKRKPTDYEYRAEDYHFTSKDHYISLSASPQHLAQDLNSEENMEAMETLCGMKPNVPSATCTSGNCSFTASLARRTWEHSFAEFNRPGGVAGSRLATSENIEKIVLHERVQAKQGPECIEATKEAIHKLLAPFLPKTP